MTDPRLRHARLAVAGYDIDIVVTVAETEFLRPVFQINPGATYTERSIGSIQRCYI